MDENNKHGHPVRAAFQKLLQNKLKKHQLNNRLKKLLLSCVDSGRLNDGGWYDLCVAWTHQSIAAVMGINRVTVSRFITELKSEGFLRIVNGSIQISKTYFDLLGE